MGVAHVAIVVAATAGFLQFRANVSLFRSLTTAIEVLMVLLNTALFAIARRSPEMRSISTAYALFTAGMLCVLLGSFVKTEPLAIAIAILCALLFGAGVTLIVRHIRVRNSQ